MYTYYQAWYFKNILRRILDIKHKYQRNFDEIIFVMSKEVWSQLMENGNRKQYYPFSIGSIKNDIKVEESRNPVFLVKEMIIKDLGLTNCEIESVPSISTDFPSFISLDNNSNTNDKNGTILITNVSYMDNKEVLIILKVIFRLKRKRQ